MKYEKNYERMMREREAALAKLEPTKSIYDRLKRNAAGEAILDDDLIAAIETLLAEGSTRANAARVVGLQRTTLQKWINKGRQDILDERPSIYAKLVFTIDRCEGDQERRLAYAAFRAALSTMADGGMALKILERRNPDEWAPALPATPEVAAQFQSLSVTALKKESERILKQLQSAGEVTVEPSVSAPDAEVVDKPEQ